MKKALLVIAALTAFILAGCGQQQGQSTPERETQAPATSTPSATRTATLRPTNTPTVTATPTPGIGSTITREKDGAVMVYVPAGEFKMGSDNDDWAEQPAHAVTLDAYWIDQTEVTNGMYEQCVKAGACDPPQENGSATRSSYYANNQYDDYPAINVKWSQAKAYCEWAGAGLPTDAQWEKAARGTDGRTFPWGEGIDCTRTNYDACKKGDTVAVGGSPAGTSPYGALDMAGNVWEWSNDWFDITYYANSPSSNPQGPASGESHVMRGGSWADGEYLLRSSYRFWDMTGQIGWFNVIGFRCARSP